MLVVPVDGVAGDLSNRGEVVGSTIAGGFIWSVKRGFIQPLSTESAAFYAPVAINDRGQIVGVTTVDGISTHVALRSASGRVRDLGALGPFSSGFSFAQPTALNDRGEVVGQSSSPSDEYHAFLWTARTGMTDFGATSFLRDINNRGHIVGTIGTQAVLWSEVDAWQELGILGVSPLSYFYSSANAINDRGWVVGGSTAREGGAFLWTPKGGMENLGFIQPTSGVYHFSEASDINERGSIVGISRSTTFLPTPDDDEVAFEEHPFVWTTRTGMIDLNTLISPSSGWWIAEPIAINDRNEILAVGLHPTVGQRYVILEPTHKKQIGRE